MTRILTAKMTPQGPQVKAEKGYLNPDFSQASKEKELNPKDIFTRFINSTDKDGESVQLIEAAYEKFEHLPEIHHLVYGKYLESLNKLEEAEGCYKKGLQDYPGSHDLSNALNGASSSAYAVNASFTKRF